MLYQVWVRYLLNFISPIPIGCTTPVQPFSIYSYTILAGSKINIANEILRHSNSLHHMASP